MLRKEKIMFKNHFIRLLWRISAIAYAAYFRTVWLFIQQNQMPLGALFP